VILSHAPPCSCKSKGKEKEKKRNINNDLAILPSHDKIFVNLILFVEEMQTTSEPLFFNTRYILESMKENF